MSLILDGSNGLTFPNSTTQASAGQVLQVVQTLSQASASTTSSSWTTTGVSASITPKFANSKIVIMITGQLYETAASNQGFMTVYRGALNELTGGVSNGFPPSIYSQANAMVAGATMNYIDSPATTSSTTYTIYYRTTGGTLYWNGASSLTTIILMEIAG